MKKVLLVVLSFLVVLEVVNGKEVIKEEGINYVELGNGNLKEVSKVYDENMTLYFNIDMTNYDIGNSFAYFSDFSESDCKGTKEQYDLFKTIVYFGYLNNPTDKNYLVTQLLIWSKVSGFESEVDYALEKLNPEYTSLYESIWAKVTYHLDDAMLISNLWDRINFDYKNMEVLNNQDGLELTEFDNMTSVFNKNIGSYELLINYPEEDTNFLISTSNNSIYWQSLGGPLNGYKKIYYDVIGANVQINEKIIGVNGLLGDAQNNNSYELYLNDLLVLDFDNLNFLIGGDKYYTLKSKNNIGFNEVNLTFRASTEDFQIDIEKKVISKKYKVNITDDKVYQIYLKSNNELYMEVSKDTLEVELPFGEYELKYNEQIIKELSVKDDKSEEIIIKDKEEIEEKEPIENDDKQDTPINKVEQLDNKISTNKDDYKDTPIVNPQTGFNNLNLILIFTGLFSLLLFLIYKYYIIKRDVNKILK